MDKKDKFSSVIIGSTSLPIRCAEILQRKGHEIRAIVSSDPEVKKWATENSVTSLEPGGDFTEQIGESFDYLFSIVNEHILRDNFLRLARKLAINYHDAPLPRYAGTHATSWALMNGVTTHGISWHVITDVVDAGDILKQQIVEISSDDTALMLNTKCYEAAIDAFENLVDDLANDTVTRRVQNLNERTFFARFKRPGKGGLISWNQSASEISALVRALNFGNHPNPLGSAKILAGSDLFIVKNAEILDSCSPSEPGTINEIGIDYLKVSAADREMILRNILTIDGEAISIPDLTAQLGLHNGFRCTTSNVDTTTRIEALYQDTCKSEKYWLNKLAALEPAAPPYLNSSTASVADHASLSTPVSEGLSKLAEGRNFDVLFAVFGALVARLTGADVFDIGYFDADLNNEIAGSENLFESRLPFRFNIEDSQNIAELLAAFDLEMQLVKKHKTFARDITARFPQLEPGKYVLPVCVAKVRSLEEFKPRRGNDLTLVVSEDESGCHWIYDRNRITGENFSRLASNFTTLLEGIIADPARPLAYQPILTEAERHQLLVDWNDRPARTINDGTIHRLFEEHAARTPDASAIAFGETRLSYGELNRRANQLANYLISLGVGPEVRLCVCVEPSLFIGEALLGILKAGGVYIPLDPTYPRDRLAAMIEDIRPAVVLTQEHLLQNLPETTADIICLDRDRQSFDKLPSENLDIEIDPEQTAYIVYTSGTTGKPKGAMASYRNLAHYILEAQERYGFDRSTVMPAMARFTFSITFFELLNPLVAGGTLVILERNHILDFERMAATLEQLTVIHASPSLFKRLLAFIEDNEIDPTRFNRLKHVSTGGDTVPPEVLEAMKRVFRNAEIYVIYGCSEVSCMATTKFVSRMNAITRTLVGRPFPNVSVRIFDSEQNPVLVGAKGEVYIGGAGVTKGYLNLEELTDKKFIRIDGERFYKTGDRGRLDVDGNLEILGRTDFQIKLNGIRIEPVEIETFLRQVPGVKDAVVAKRELSSGEPGIVGYLVLDQDKAVGISQIRSFLKRKLPDYMMPSAFVVLEALPVNLNQKIDRHALPAPDESNLRLEEEHSDPETEIEKQTASVWSEVLRLDRIGVNNDFFELGGQSLLATQVVSRLREKFEVDLAINSLFEYPTVRQLAERIVELRDDSKAKISHIPITRAPRGEIVPLSFSQQRVWFLNQLDEKDVAYNIPAAVELNGELNVDALEKAIAKIAARHEILRTVFRNVDGEPVQVILPEVGIKLRKIDLRNIPAEEQTAEVERLLTEEAQTPFDLRKLPLFRTTLIRTGPESHVFQTNFHHIVYDGWSIDRFTRELSQAYSAIAANESDTLPELPLQYADFADWQRHESSPLQDSLEYWRRQLSGAPDRLELPIDRARPAVQTFNGSTRSFSLDPKLASRLEDLSRKSGTTLFMTLLAAYATLMSRYSHQDDIVVGSPIASRTRSELESLIGFFVNTLPLRLDLQGDPSFTELLNRVRRVSLDAFEHQNVPFEKIVEDVNPGRSRCHSPLFQAMFVLQNAPMGDLNLPGVTAKPMSVKRGVSMFDLTLWINETESGLSGEWEYNTDLFEASTIDRMASHFETLLESVIANPALPVSKLSSLTDAERHQLIVGWNDEPRAYAEQESIHKLFEAQVLRTPDAAALVFGSERLTYLELNRRANRLSHHLRSLGVGPETLVGVCVERSVEMIVGILAILKSGGAYVPMDPAYPRERIEHMLSDSQAPVLLAKEKSAEGLSGYNCNIVRLDADADIIALESDENPSPTAKSNNLAYVIYTSGSTGKPKGVAIEHRSTVALLNWAKTVFTSDQLRGVLASTSICFDLSVYEMFLPLSVGGSVVLVENILHLPDAPAAYEVTLINTVPSAITELIRMNGVPGSVRTVNLAGEPLKTSLVKQIYDLGHVKEVFDLYGPSEDTTYSTYTLRDTGPATIGRPITNTQAYILDRQLQPVPVGIPGELYLGGDGLARGYLNRPELTAERFIKNPFSSDPAARIYKTGDLVRYQPNGNIEYLGRIDNQVKIRGFRIELGEIEAVLAARADVKEAVVMAREDQPGDKRLVAYIVTNQAVKPGDLRDYLKQKLPDYMVPAAFVELDQMPLTPNGKVDRKALPAPPATLSETERYFVAHRDTIEAQLVGIWEKLLQVSPIGVHDNFFELGGHSLQAVRMFAEVEQTFGKNIPLATLFEAGTIEKLADILRQDGWAAPESSMVPIQPNGSRPPFFCVHAKGGNVLFYRDLAKHLGNDQPFYGIQARRLGGRQVGHATVEEMAEFYIKEMREVQPEGPYYLGGSSFGGLGALEIAQQLRRQGEKVALLALMDTGTPDYPKTLPGTTAFKARIYEYIRRIQHHRDSLAAFSASERKDYIFDKLKKVKLQYRRRINNTYKKSVRKFYLKAKGTGSIPSNYIQIEDQIWKAGQKYLPQAYGGKMTLFRATNQPLGIVPDPTLGWNGIPAELEIHDVPGHHGSIVAEPYVRVLAEKLAECIDLVVPVEALTAVEPSQNGSAKREFAKAAF